MMRVTSTFQGKILTISSSGVDKQDDIEYNYTRRLQLISSFGITRTMYNPNGLENAHMIGNVITWVFALIFLFSAVQGFFAKSSQATETSLAEKVSEYIEEEEDIYAALTGDQEYLTAHFVLKEDPPPATAKPKPSNSKPAKPSRTDKGREAVSGLVSLGYKKSDANKLVDDILTNNPNMTAEQVVFEVFHK